MSSLEVQLTPRLRHAAQRVKQQRKLQPSANGANARKTATQASSEECLILDFDDAVLQQYASGAAKTIPVAHVQQLSLALRKSTSQPASQTAAEGVTGHGGEDISEEDGRALWVHELLQGASPVLPVFSVKRPRDPALDKRIENLRVMQQNREYAAMVGKLSSGESAGRDEAEMTTFRSQLGVGMNLVVSMGTMFCVGYYCGGTEEEPHGIRAAIGGLALCIITMGVEMTLFLIGASRVDAKMAKRTEQARKEGVNDLTKMRDNYPEEVARQKRT